MLLQIGAENSCWIFSERNKQNEIPVNAEENNWMLEVLNKIPKTSDIYEFDFQTSRFSIPPIR